MVRAAADAHAGVLPSCRSSESHVLHACMQSYTALRTALCALQPRIGVGPDFPGSLRCVGHARVVASAIQLTPAAHNRAGACWYPDRLPGAPQLCASTARLLTIVRQCCVTGSVGLRSECRAAPTGWRLLCKTTTRLRSVSMRCRPGRSSCHTELSLLHLLTNSPRRGRGRPWLRWHSQFCGSGAGRVRIQGG